MPSRLRPHALLASLLALAVVLAACGGDGNGEATATAETPTATETGAADGGAVDAPEPARVEGGLAVYDVDDPGFELGVPEDWLAMTSAQFPDDDTFTEWSIDQPDVSGYFEGLVGESAMKFVAVDRRVQRGFATNVNVLVRDVEPGTSFDAFEERSLEEIRTTVPNIRGEIASERESYPAGEALKVTYERDIQLGADASVFVFRHYFFLAEEQGFILTYTTMRRLDEEFAGVFEESVRSFRVLGDD